VIGLWSPLQDSDRAMGMCAGIVVVGDVVGADAKLDVVVGDVVVGDVVVGDVVVGDVVCALAAWTRCLDSMMV
jgi:hypothetical protein